MERIVIFNITDNGLAHSNMETYYCIGIPKKKLPLNYGESPSYGFANRGWSNIPYLIAENFTLSCYSFDNEKSAKEWWSKNKKFFLENKTYTKEYDFNYAKIIKVEIGSKYTIMR